MKNKLLLCTVLLSFLIAGSLFSQQLDMKKLKDMKPRSIGPAGMSGRVTAIDVVLKEPRIMYVGTASGGLWKSVSGGYDWKPLFDKEKVLAIGAVKIDQNTPDIIWVGTGEGNPRNSNSGGYGIYKSIDAGKTWQMMGLEKTRHIHRILIDPENSDVVYVGAIGSPWGPQAERGVFKTTDGGKTWKNILFTNELSGVGDMVMDPSNHNKLIVNMWEHQRWPWFFNSGGPGSGMYLTYDGGENWKKLTEKEGLPKGELGRMGFAFSKSNPDVVYALIESKKNALYRSDDGGESWKIAGTKNIGDRPFYYSEIYVDPKNENRIYTLFSRVNVSEDGGKSFRQLIGWTIHPDFHAWWIHPDNSAFMISGNDGGMAITKDQGKTWRFVQNLPVGQFYHINVDMELPYHVYGGMQDNGSWRGPAYTWSSGGIINTYWDNLSGGDGFDVLPDPSNPRYCYSMSQQGYVGRVDLETGYNKSIRPVHPDGLKLRFNWNAAIAADPFDKNTIYFGSQFVHKSTNHGDSWEIISPDLTTNDTSKQQQLKSGGLTYDVTGAENFTTILAIAPSPLKKGMIWVGTDDGNLQLTEDGGENWKNLSEKLKGVPEGSWIPQIQPSTYNEGEAFVVVNNYRRHDYAPYLYHTTNYGKSWERMVDENSVFGYVLSFVQDPVEPKLMFLGTEDGMYVSIDAGKTWTQWTNDYPSVSTMDMVIHPREYDLVIGTYGRAAWILDDIRPLREIATKGTGVLDEEIHAFEPPVAYMVSRKNAPGYFAAGNTFYTGKNRPSGAMISFSVKEGNKETSKNSSTRVPSYRRMFGGGSPGALNPKAQKGKIEIIDESGQTIRTLTVTPKTGINRVYWGLDKKGFRWPNQPKAKPGSPERGGGGYALPGTYKLRFTYNKQKDSTMLTVKADPRLNISVEAIKQNQKAVKGVIKKMELLAEAYDRIKESKGTMATIKKITPKKKDPTLKHLKAVTKEVDSSMKVMTADMIERTDVQGIFRNPDIITSKLRGLYSALYSIEPLNDTQLLSIKQAEEIIDKTLAKVNKFYAEDWVKYRNAVEKANITPFKDYEPLE